MAPSQWIVKTLKAGARQHGRFVDIASLRAKEPGLAIIVSRKISGKAVIRNRTKRVIAAAVRARLKALEPRRIIIIAKEPLVTVATSRACRDELSELLH